MQYLSKYFDMSCDSSNTCIVVVDEISLKSTTREVVRRSVVFCCEICPDANLSSASSSVDVDAVCMAMGCGSLDFILQMMMFRTMPIPAYVEIAKQALATNHMTY